MWSVAVVAAFAHSVTGAPLPSTTPAGTVVNLRIPAAQLAAVEAISHDVWKVQYAAPNVTDILDIDLHVAHDRLGELRALRGVTVTGVMIEDVTATLKEQASKRTGEWDREASKATIGAKNDPFFDEYRTHDEINEYTLLLAVLHPELTRYVPTIGDSEEGYAIPALIVGGSDGGPAVYHQCGLHAREWITHATCLFMIVEMLESEDPLVRRLVDSVRHVFVPNANPDGYLWSWAPNGNRLWRKNRGVNVGTTCIGTDLNRNWDEMWGDGPPGCASTNPCSDTYRGASAASEAETAVLQDFVNEIGNTHEYLGAIDWHSYTQLILRPFGYQASPVPPNDAFAEEVGAAMVEAIFAEHGLRYTNQPSTDLYPVCGCAIDYLYEATLGVTFTMELRPASLAGGGFVIPDDQIVPTGEENFAGLMVYTERVFEAFRKKQAAALA